MATEPTTPQEWNEAVAKALGETTEPVTEIAPHGKADKKCFCHECFEPYGDKPENIAAAVWALERFCKSNSLWPEIYMLKKDGNWKWTCYLHVILGENERNGKEESIDFGEGTFGGCICEAIVGAAS